MPWSDSHVASSRAAFIGTEVRMHRDADGRTKSYHNAAAYEAWKPYGEAFGRIDVVGRVEASSPSEHGVYVDGVGVHVVPVRYYHGLRQLLFRFPEVARQVFSLGDRTSVFIGKLPEPISLLLYLRARFLGAKFIALLVSEPDQLYRSLFPGWRGRVLARVFAAITRNCIRHSGAVIYVTQYWLQRLYSSRPGTPTIGYSSIGLEGLLADGPRHYERARRRVFRLVAVGTMETKYKGFDQLCSVVRILRDHGNAVELTIVGGGRERANIQRYAEDLGVAEFVTFTGHLESAAEIRAVLDDSHLFVMASLVEGLPRALIEAMARGLPAVSTRAGGVEELIPDEYLVPIGDVRGLASIVEQLMHDPEELERLSRRSWELARRTVELSGESLLVDFLRKACF